MKTTAFLLVLITTACSSRSPDIQLATAIASQLRDACPLAADPADEAARDACAARLTDAPALRAAMREPFIWGGQRDGAGYSLERGTNKFNPRVWRRLYLSTFMFGEMFAIERTGDDTVLHVPVQFRGAMPPGAYPYPFWHSEKKWRSYNQATTIHFVIRDGVVLGALRGADRDEARPVIAREWFGDWTPTPHVSLYSYLFSSGNPHVRRLDESYRALEASMREHRCLMCHAPDNKGKADQLEFFVYPNQALAGRHDIIDQLGDDQMPPVNELGVSAGLSDEDRSAMLALAKDFAIAGDAALAWDGEHQDALP